MTNERKKELRYMTGEELKKQKLTKEEKRYLQNGIDSSEPLNNDKVEFTKEEKEESRKILLDVINRYSTK